MNSLVFLTFFLSPCLVLLIAAHGRTLSPSYLAHARRSLSACNHPSLDLRSTPSENRLRKRSSFIAKHVPRSDPTPTSSAIPSVPSEHFNHTIPACILAHESMEGPFYLSDELLTPDIRHGQPGTDLILDLQIFDMSTCKPVKGAFIDIWHANATGVYSGYEVQGTAGENWHRGVAESDEDGVVHMVTKMPGFYQGRAVHIHIKGHAEGQKGEGGKVKVGKDFWTGQLYFPMDMVEEVMDTRPYSLNTGVLVSNEKDPIFTGAVDENWNGVMRVEKLDSGTHVAWIAVGMELDGKGDQSDQKEEPGQTGSKDQEDQKEDVKSAGNRPVAPSGQLISGTLEAWTVKIGIMVLVLGGIVIRAHWSQPS